MKDALELWDSFLIAFTALLPLINPLGSALVFLGLVGNVPAQTYRTLARKIALESIRDLREDAIQLAADQEAWFKAHPPAKQKEGQPGPIDIPR